MVKWWAMLSLCKDSLLFFLPLIFKETYFIQETNKKANKIPTTNP